jgi:hypothetical protein
MGSIAEASAEQSRGVQQVNKTVTEMDRVVQQNAAAVQQSASAATGMRTQAEELVRAVGTFQLTIEERVEGARLARAAAATPRSAGAQAPLARARQLAQVPTRATPAPAPAAAAGEEWEEF